MRLLLATDGSTLADAATQAVVAEVKRDGADIRVIHLVNSKKEVLPEMTASRHAPCSVEIVRAPKPQQTPQGLRILLAMDDSEFSETVANAVITQVKSERAEVKLLTVLDPWPLAEALAEVHQRGSKEYPDFAGAVVKLRDQAIRKLLKTAKKLESVGFKVTQMLAEEGDPRDDILDCAERWRADLIVVGSRGDKGTDCLLMGSVAEAVSRHARCSVEIVRLPSNERRIAAF